MGIDQLREQVRCPVIALDEDGYDEARRVHNGMFDRRPRAVVRAEQVADVMAAVNFARENALDLAVRGGGHSAPGFGSNDDGLVVDLSLMRHVHVDPAAGTARAGGGATWGDFNYATHAYGLATTGGIVSTTGVGGLTLGGGIGYLTRGYGLSIDNLLSADVVTADGRPVRASQVENEDLFWAIRGGGGNFGVVTSFEFQLHPVDMVTVGLFFYELDYAGDLLRFWREWIKDAPETYGAFPAFQIAPPLPFVPENRHGDRSPSRWCTSPGRSRRATRRWRRSATSRRVSGRWSPRCPTRGSTARSTRSSRRASAATGRATTSPN
jgi:FAD/FMN-containing dehydrogenase